MTITYRGYTIDQDSQTQRWHWWLGGPYRDLVPNPDETWGQGNDGFATELAAKISIDDWIAERTQDVRSFY